MSPNHFSSIFSQEMGSTFIEYLIGKRMERAKRASPDNTDAKL